MPREDGCCSSYSWKASLIAITGTAAGLAIAPLVSHSLSLLLLGGQFETQVDTSLDVRVFAFAALTAILSTLLVGLLPALQATSGSLSEHIKEGQQTTQARERHRMTPRGMMACEVGLALMLVVGAGLLATSLARLYKSGAGFDPKGVQNIEFRMDQQPLKDAALVQFYRQMGEDLLRQPGVKNVSFAQIIPLTHFVWNDNFSAQGGKTYNVYENSVSPNYFQTMRIPLFAGRDFLWTDTDATGRKIILNQAAAILLFQNRNPIGQVVNGQQGNKTIQFQVIGVVGNAKYEDLRSAPPPSAYLPMTQDIGQLSRSYNAVVRIDGPAAPLANSARALVMEANPAIPAPIMTSMESSIPGLS